MAKVFILMYRMMPNFYPYLTHRSCYMNSIVAVEVWLEYLQFSIGNMGTEKDAAKNVRQLFERALTAVGLHTIKGAIIWEAFREFEAVLYALVGIKIRTAYSN